MPLLTCQSYVGLSLTLQRGIMQDFGVGYSKAALGPSLYVIGCKLASFLVYYMEAKKCVYRRDGSIAFQVALMFYNLPIVLLKIHEAHFLRFPCSAGARLRGVVRPFNHTMCALGARQKYTGLLVLRFLVDFMGSPCLTTGGVSMQYMLPPSESQELYTIAHPHSSILSSNYLTL